MLRFTPLEKIHSLIRFGNAIAKVPRELSPLALFIPLENTLWLATGLFQILRTRSLIPRVSPVRDKSLNGVSFLTGFIKALYISVILFSFSAVFPEISFTEIKANLSLSGGDRILILAPHPDDAAIGCAGIIQEAVRLRAELKVLYLTEGEHNPASLIASKKRLFFRDKHQAFIQLGKIRKKESIEAMRSLGLHETQLVFLDYPDSGLMQIFTEHWGEGNEYKDELTGLKKTAEGEGIKPSAPYSGEAILRDLEQVIAEFRPNKIFVSHPFDQHSDHIGVYLFLKAALLELQGAFPRPKIYLYIVHYRHWPRPSGLHPDRALLPPKKLMDLALNWLVFKLSPKQREKKEQAIIKFESQVKYSRSYLFSFLRLNEIFSEDISDIYLDTRRYASGSVPSGLLDSIGERDDVGSGIKAASFYSSADALGVDITFLKRLPATDGLSGTLYLFGYRKKKPFEKMPKLKIGFRSDSWAVYNQEHKLNKSGCAFKFEKKGLHFTVPLPLLGRPDSIFYFLKTDLAGTRLNKWGPWRMIILQR